MSWKFWKKDSNKKNEKLAGPRDIPAVVGRHLVIHMHKDPDWVWHLKSVVRLRNKKKRQYDVRVFDEAQAYARGVNVENYNSLNEHPELIIFEGWYDRKSWRAHIKERKRPGQTSLAA